MSEMRTAGEVLRALGSQHGLHDSSVQQAYANFVSDAIACARQHGSGQVFAEAETGTGKTIGYLVAAGLDCARHGSRAIVSTYTLALQRQILRSDMARALAIVREETGVALSYAPRMGRRNFVDPERAQRVVQAKLRTPTLSAEDKAALQAFADWAQDHPGGELREFIDEAGLDALPCGILFEDVCISASTDRKSEAFAAYQAHVDASRNADIVVTNHAMLVTDAIYGDSEILHSSDDPRGIGVIILDECDRMPEAARSATSTLFSVHDTRVAIHNWRKVCAAEDLPAADAAFAALLTLDEAMGIAAAALQVPDEAGVEAVHFWDDLSGSVRATVQPALVRLSDALQPWRKDAAERISQMSDEARDAWRTLARLSRECADLADALEGKADAGSGAQRSQTQMVALRWSPTRKWPSIKTFRLYPARVLKRVWNEWTDLGGGGDKAEPVDEKTAARRARDAARRAKALVLTSATISAPSRSGKPNFVELKNAFGIFDENNPCESLMVERSPMFAPKQFGTVDIVFSHPLAPAVYLGQKDSHAWSDDGEGMEHNPAWVTYCAMAALRAHEQGGRVLVLCNSYKAAQKIADALRAMKLPVVEKTRTNTADACLRRFVEDPGAIYVSPSAWEGFDPSQIRDAKGERVQVKHVVITQAPFPSPDGALMQALRRHLLKKGVPADRVETIVYGNARAAALRRFRQGFGRGIRSLTDRFTLWLCDPRFPRSSAAREALGEAGVVVRSDFLYAIPRRFRESAASLSAWDRGSVLDVTGKVIPYEDLVVEV